MLMCPTISLTCIAVGTKKGNGIPGRRWIRVGLLRCRDSVIFTLAESHLVALARMDEKEFDLILADIINNALHSK